MTPLSDLDDLIRAGWGDTPQHKIPADWRERQPGGANGGRRPRRKPTGKRIEKPQAQGCPWEELRNEQKSRREALRKARQFVLQRPSGALESILEG